MALAPMLRATRATETILENILYIDEGIQVRLEDKLL